jgi:hypothetical protein
VNSNREEFSSNRQIFGAEQGLLCFSSRLERLGCRRRHSPAFQPHDPVDSPDQLSDGARKIDLMVKRNPRSPATLQREKSHYICDYGPRSRGDPIHQIWRHRFGGTQQLEEFALLQLTSNCVQFRPWHCPIIPANRPPAWLFLPTAPKLAGSSRSCPSRSEASTL